MADIRTLIAEDESTQTWEIRNDKGELVCVSVEPVLSPEELKAQEAQAKAVDALPVLDAYLAKPAVSNEELAAQVKVLTETVDALTRAVFGGKHDDKGG